MLDSDDLYQIALLVDQMKHDDVTYRITAFKNLERIAQALGVERTRDELIPFLAESVEDEDSVLLVIAEKLGSLCTYLGSSDNIYALLKPLELLICGEESSIRDKALLSAEEIVKKMSEAHVLQYLFPLLHSLSNRDWFTARSSAASLAPLLYLKVEESKKAEILKLLMKLSDDDAPAVRRSVAKSLPSILRASSPNLYKDLADLYTKFAKDDQDSIRIQVIPASAVFVELLSMDSRNNILVPTLVNVATDRSWRVRWSLSHHLKEVFPFFAETDSNAQASSSGNKSAGGSSTSNTLATLANMYDSLLNDPEPEVRAAAAVQLSGICQYLPKATITSRIIPTVQRLANDNSEFVRAVISGEISMLSPMLGKEDTIKLLLPLMLSLLRDEASDVRLNVISQLHGINSTIGVELLSQSLLPAIITLAQDVKWRVRLAVIELMPMIGKQLGVQIFTEHLISICIGWLHDTIHAIRKCAASNIKQLALLFGDDWALNHVVPPLENMSSNSHYLQRMTSANAAQVLIENFPEHVELNKALISMMCELKTDNVANVRLTLAKVLLTPLQILPSKMDGLKAEIQNTLKGMLNDSDRDVRFYANETLNKYQAGKK